MINDYKAKIIAFYERHRRMPSYQEIMGLVGFKSKNAVYKLINKLVDEGVVSKDSKGRLVPTTRLTEIPLLGLVEAGIPTTAEEVYSDTMSLDDFLIKNKESTYLLEVKGESMIEAGIHEGDLVIAERATEAKDGQIVIAEVDGGFTMKYYRRDGNRVYLEPANKDFDLIIPKQELRIAAIVKGVIRKY